MQISYLKEWIQSTAFIDLISALDTDNTNADDFLDRRDAVPFEQKWLADFKLLEDFSYSADQVKSIDLLREITFKVVYQCTQNSELASYLSDDMELITKSFSQQQTKIWAIQHLWLCYQKGIDPTL